MAFLAAPILWKFAGNEEDGTSIFLRGVMRQLRVVIRKKILVPS